MQLTEETSSEHTAQMTRESATLDSTGYLLHKVTLPRLEDIEDIPNT